MRNINLISILFALSSRVIGHPVAPKDVVKRGGGDEDDWESPVYKQLFRMNHHKSLGELHHSLLIIRCREPLGPSKRVATIDYLHK